MPRVSRRRERGITYNHRHKITRVTFTMAIIKNKKIPIINNHNVTVAKLITIQMIIAKDIKSTIINKASKINHISITYSTITNILII